MDINKTKIENQQTTEGELYSGNASSSSPLTGQTSGLPPLPELLTFPLGNAESLKALKQLILEKTEDTPFCMEEVVQTLVEEGALVGDRGRYRLEHTPTELHISPTVQGVLATRIDRLTTEGKELLQQLSVIGRRFPASLVQQVVSQPEAELYGLLALV